MINHRKSITASLIILLVAAVLISGVWVSRHDNGSYNYEPLLPPSGEHWLGTDDMGRDLLCLLLSGVQVTVGIALAAAALSVFTGILLGVLSAYYGNWVDVLILEVTGLFIIVPEIVLLTCVAAFAKPHVVNTVLAIAFLSWSKVARIIRPKAITALSKEKIQYTRLLKGGLTDIISKLRYELQPVAATLFVLQCSRAAVFEATLSFLGIGDPLVRSLGGTIRAALNYHGIFQDGVYLWYLLPPVMCLCLFVLLLSLLAFKEEQDDAWGDGHGADAG